MGAAVFVAGRIGVSVRAARAVDVAAVVDLWHAMRLEAGLGDDLLVDDWRPRLEGFLGETISSGRAAVWLAEIDGTVVGTALGLLKEDYPFFLFRPGLYGFVGCVYTAPEWRRLGVATDLVGRAVAWLREQGATTVRLLPTEASRSIYEAMGFRPTGDLELG